MLLLVLVIVSGLFMTLGARGNWDFVLSFRGIKLAALILVGTCIAVATILFQTLSANRILTPSIMGFDALYILLQTSMVFALGGLGYATFDPQYKFMVELVLLVLAATALFGTLLGRSRQDIQRMILTGIIFGVLFRSLTSFLQRMIDPSEFAIIQIGSFARFNRVETDLLIISAVISGLALVAVWRMRHRLDVIALGREHAISLGLDHRKSVLMVLALIALLVAVSTALVGPVAFFGLLVSSMAHLVMKNHRHELLLPASALIAGIILVGGQMLIERVLGLQTTLSVVVEFAGGLVFLFLLLKGSTR